MTAVYVLVAEAVYDHGVIGVYATEADARAAAETLWPQTDGHHDMRIDVREIGATHPDVFSRGENSGREPGTPRITTDGGRG